MKSNATIKLDKDTAEACKLDTKSNACVKGDEIRDARLAWNTSSNYYSYTLENQAHIDLNYRSYIKLD
jgi:hypothetical protein